MQEDCKEELMNQYEVEETVRFIRDNRFQKVCLQFPDHLLSDSPQVVDELERRSEAEFYVLGDTAYAPCCVDVIAAQHVAADAVVHYGHACLSPSRDLPVHYVFEKKNLLHMEDLVHFLKQSSASHLVVLFESYYGHLQGLLFSHLECHIPEKTIIPVHFRKPSVTDDLESAVETNIETQSRKYTIGHLEFELDLSISTEQLQFVWLGSPSSSSYLRASLSLYPNALDCYDDSTDSWVLANGSATNTFKKRLALVSRAQKSCVFGIVVSAVATTGVLDAVERCEMLLNKFGMEWYVLNVGKPTPTKLANFPEIEVFVLIGCPESAFLDSKSYMKPILTMAELELALDSRVYYTDIGSIHDFRDTLSRSVIAKEQVLDDDNENVDKFCEEDTSNALNKSSLGRGLTAHNISSSLSATFLRHRTWNGVEEEASEENKPHSSKEGKSGIPSGYNNEGSGFS
ncbi:hypothetical protein GpartN1_g3522.t1 [Galdieria partita]|uniref:2-(3-amino-3-carboxypropyl)histidine synthase subunit 2 n=1 Tax=Galdieria partita TaxID=83374 RepID=A0A9C7PXL6_9RHOD|nr:hypothetical protein GpartN1_g3522.t1 [Galdieria partita]